MPRISEFLGIYIYMYFSDHNPPHFQAIYGQFDAEFAIENGKRLKGFFPPAQRNPTVGVVRMKETILHVDSARYVRDYLVEIVFDDGTEKTVDVSPLLSGPMFEPLLDRRMFAKLTIDPVSKTVVWPNGADLAPEALYDLPPVNQVA